jgi:predicted TIM-barrel fold metal-dependent hydrolase
VAAIEYRVEHKLLFGTDFPFFTARQTIDGLRSLTGTPFGPDLPRIDEQVVEDIINRPTLELLEISASPRS